MSFRGFLAQPDGAGIKAPKVPGTMDLEELNERAHPEFKRALEANNTIKLCRTSPVEVWNRQKRQRQDLARSLRKANISTNRYGLTNEEMKTYRESPDKFENILAAHAASGVIPYLVDLKISFAAYTRLLCARDVLSDSICNRESNPDPENLPIGDSLLTSLIFLELWSRLQPPVFSQPEPNTTIDKWIENIKEQNFALRESAKWGPLCKLYEQLTVDETNFYEPRHDSLDSPDFDSE
ncbi:uncharacterized protein EAF02_007892 [Botrytis sinoallii]|uniref:uncharacterized protein n=1 Tax=Botrytis sinoallii TaxID=1463999 RepID=UPI0018FFBADD|nr:uncharacterized protein EAF02_007892 [Botrytis sinoallii]KAF7879722.1 hypothetical protein EAF02_007892 [Botrytis sinoallii]